ncbi:MAG: DUF397 domain-containing protein [Dactylosporangium sp.]|nr:DUF397 domain-containing protein [Dactylosporangium sp.]NNJ60226.1 DUF397 domain-containing protein [Dactylosporangium sp.]
MSELARAIWRKSSNSINGECVEMAPLTNVVAVRDSKDPGGPVLMVSPRQWRLFVHATAAGTIGDR